MDLTCPKCNSQETQKLSMVMYKGLFGKLMRFGIVFVYNLWIPVASVFFGVMFGIVFGLVDGYLGLFAFLATLVAGFFSRRWVKAKAKSKYADLSDNMKQNGFQCQRCEHLFIPVESFQAPAPNAQIASA
jgi:ribose/xylose/arabinose/galactoside ABC-type transport system permease subunit